MMFKPTAEKLCAAKIVKHVEYIPLLLSVLSFLQSSPYVPKYCQSFTWPVIVPLPFSIASYSSSTLSVFPAPE